MGHVGGVSQSPEGNYLDPTNINQTPPTLEPTNEENVKSCTFISSSETKVSRKNFYEISNVNLLSSQIFGQLMLKYLLNLQDK